jgi:hypothetical protein
MAKYVFYINLLNGVLIIMTAIFGYSTIRHNYIDWKLFVYNTILTVYYISFIYKPEWINVTYSDEDGWVTNPVDTNFWLSFMVIVGTIVLYELIIPLIQAYLNTHKQNRWYALGLIFGVVFALFSMALMFMDLYLRVIVADIGFFIFFFILAKKPFVGFSDSTEIHQVILARDSGVPAYIHTGNRSHAILTAGAMISINAVLEEIRSFRLGDGTIIKRQDMLFRKIELGMDYFYITMKSELIIIFHYSNASGVSIPKFISLSRMLSYEDTNIQDLVVTLQQGLLSYFSTINISIDL